MRLKKMYEKCSYEFFGTGVACIIFNRTPPKVGPQFTISSAVFPVFQPVSGAAPAFEMKIMGILIEEFKHCPLQQCCQNSCYR